MILKVCMMENKKLLAERLADLMFDLLENCQQKQEKIAKSLNLTVSEFKALRLLKKDQFVSVGELAKRMVLSNSRLTRIIDGLVNKGIIRRDINPEDRRVMEIILTLEGTKLTDSVNEKYFQSQFDIIENIPKDKLVQLLSSLELLRESLHRWVKK
jgi:DNA-binding MarR family transcriptional regulator